MWSIVFTILIIIVLAIAINKIITEKKKSATQNLKGLVTSICFLLISVINLAGYWLGVLGIITMTLTVVLLITGAYFVRYMDTDNRKKTT